MTDTLILVHLLHGLHLNDQELARAKELVHQLTITLKNYNHDRKIEP